MPQINVGRREITCKLVYYGPGLSGKTTNLEMIHKRAPASKRGQLTAIATTGDRTLFFDFMPLELGKVGGMNIKFQLYTVPGQSYYRATRALVLRGVDGVVFVADSQPDKLDENRESLRDLRENLSEEGVELRKVPLVLQWNKRDMNGALPIEVLDKALNLYGVPTLEAVASTGEGVFPTLRLLVTLVLERLQADFGVRPTKGEQATPLPRSPLKVVPPAAPPASRPEPLPVAVPPPTRRVPRGPQRIEASRRFPRPQTPPGPTKLGRLLLLLALASALWALLGSQRLVELLALIWPG